MEKLLFKLVLVIIFILYLGGIYLMFTSTCHSKSCFKECYNSSNCGLSCYCAKDSPNKLHGYCYPGVDTAYE